MSRQFFSKGVLQEARTCTPPESWTGRNRAFAPENQGRAAVSKVLKLSVNFVEIKSRKSSKYRKEAFFISIFKSSLSIFQKYFKNFNNVSKF
jgi:hypothetical protein